MLFSLLGWRRLGFAGVTGFVPCLSFDLHLEHRLAVALVHALVSLTKITSFNDRANTERGLSRIVGKRLSYRGVPRWRKHKPIILDEAARSKSLTVAYDGLLAALPASGVEDADLQLGCPMCSSVRSIGGVRVLKGTTWNKIWCNQCRKSKKARSWTCICGKPWVQCQVHSAVVFRCSLSTKPKGMPMVNPDKVGLRPSSRANMPKAARRTSLSSTGGPQLATCKPRGSKRKFSDVFYDDANHSSMWGGTAVSSRGSSAQRHTMRLGPILVARFPHLCKDVYVQQ